MKVAAYCAVAGIDIAWALYFADQIFYSRAISIANFAGLAAFSAGALYFVLAAIREVAE